MAVQETRLKLTNHIGQLITGLHTHSRPDSNAGAIQFDEVSNAVDIPATEDIQRLWAQSQQADLGIQLSLADGASTLQRLLGRMQRLTARVMECFAPLTQHLAGTGKALAHITNQGPLEELNHAVANARIEDGSITSSPPSS